MTKTINERCQLTPKQKQAFDELVKAVDKCKKVKVLFYHNLDTLGALNGHQVNEVADDIELRRRGLRHIKNKDHSLNYTIDYPSVNLVCSWADDEHYVVMRDEI